MNRVLWGCEWELFSPLSAFLPLLPSAGSEKTLCPLSGFSLWKCKERQMERDREGGSDPYHINAFFL